MKIISRDKQTQKILLMIQKNGYCEDHLCPCKDVQKLPHLSKWCCVLNQRCYDIRRSDVIAHSPQEQEVIIARNKNTAREKIRDQI